MSHFTEMEVNYDQKFEKDLVAALEMQFGEGNVEVHEEGAALFGFQGDNRANKAKSSADYAPPCHIVIRRKNVGNASNDVGYRRTEDGKYVAYVSDFDKGHNYSRDKQNKVTQNYSTMVAEKNLKKQGWIVKRSVKEDGTIRITADSYSK